MKITLRSGQLRKPNEMLKLILTTFVGIVFGFGLGVSFPRLPRTKMKLEVSLMPSIDLTYVEDKYSGLSTQAWLNVWSTLKGRKVGPSKGHSLNDTKVWVPTNPRGAERLPPGIVVSETDFYNRRLHGMPEEDLSRKPNYLVAFTVGYEQRDNIDACIKKFSDNFTIVLLHYDGRVTEWNEFVWAKQAIHISASKQTKWWYAKRFLHPSVVAAYDYIFIWDEDLGVENFDAEEYLKLVKKHGLEISQPGLEPNRGLTWQMTKRRVQGEVHKVTEEKPGWCPDPFLPPCAAFIEIMAPVFSRNAWCCVWHMIQNDLVHGWGLDFALRMCVEGEATNGKAPWKGVRKRCKSEWEMFQDRIADAESAYFESLGFTINNTARYPTRMK